MGTTLSGLAHYGEWAQVQCKRLSESKQDARLLHASLKLDKLPKWR